MVKDLRRFVRLDESEWQTTGINQNIENVLILLESEIREGIEIKKYFNKLPKLYCSLSNLNQVFLLRFSTFNHLNFK